METENNDVYILGIESSCDDTSAAVLRNGVLLSNVTASQEVHRAYGGVVPELASRAHQQNVVPVVDQAIKRAGITKEQLSAIAFAWRFLSLMSTTCRDMSWHISSRRATMTTTCLLILLSVCWYQAATLRS